MILFIHISPDCTEYEVWYTAVLIGSLQVIYMKIPSQVIPHWIGKYKFYDPRILV